MLINLGTNEQLKVDEVISITQCVFCKKNLTAKQDVDTSKLLPCLHASCQDCLNVRFNKGENVCLSCSFPFTRDKLYDNKVLFEIVSDIDLPKISNKLCSIHNCPVTNWCQDCNDFICEDCVKSHGQLKSTIAHSIISKDNHFVRLLASTPKNVFPCEVHTKNNLTIHCHTCRAMTCRDCQLEEHKDHKYDFINDEVDTVKIELFNILKKIEYNAVVMNAALGKCEEKETKLNGMKKKLILDIRKEFDKVRQILQEREKELMLSAISKVNTKLEECGSNKFVLSENLSVVNRCINFVKCVLFTSSDPVLFYTKDLMANYMKHININTRIPCSYGTLDLSFNPDCMIELKNKILGCGAISENYKFLIEKKDPRVLHREVMREWATRNQFINAMEGSEHKVLTANSFFEAELSDCGSGDHDTIIIEDEGSFETSQHNRNIQSTKFFNNSSDASLLKVSENLSKLPWRSQKALQSSIGRDQNLLMTPNYRTSTSNHQLVTNQSQNNLSITLNQHVKCPNQQITLRVGVQSGSIRIPGIHEVQQSTSKNTPRLWHIPENIQMAQASLTAGRPTSDMRKIRIPNQLPQLDYQALVNDEILQELYKNPGEDERSEECHLNQRSSTQLSPPGGMNEDWCSVCLFTGSLVFCNNCPKGFHRHCHIPPIKTHLVSEWRCLLCEDINPLPPATYHYFRPDEMKVAYRLLLEMFCQVEASAPFRQQIRTYDRNKSNLSLLDIKYNLSQGKYVSILKFIADIRTLLVNCFRTRLDEPQVIAHAKTLEEIFARLLAKFIPYLNASSN